MGMEAVSDGLKTCARGHTYAPWQRKKCPECVRDRHKAWRDRNQAKIVRWRAQTVASGMSAVHALAYRDRRKDDPAFLERAADAQRRYRERHPESDLANKLSVSVDVARQITAVTGP